MSSHFIGDVLSSRETPPERGRIAGDLQDESGHAAFAGRRLRLNGSNGSTLEYECRSPSLRLPLARLLQLLMILQSERYPNATRLAEACAVSRRTIYRDLTILEAAGITVIYRPDRQGYQLARECLLQPTQLEDKEALALLDLSRLGMRMTRSVC